MSKIFKFDASEPVKIRGGTLHQGFKKHLPDLKGLSIQSVHLEEGAVQAPHFHPNASQLDYCLSGKARLGIIDPDGRKKILTMNPGDISFVPSGYTHWFENIGQGTLHYLVVFSHEEPVHVDIHKICLLYTSPSPRD